MAEHKVRFWRGTRANYDFLKKSNALDYWTKYSVQEGDGSWSEYFGANNTHMATGTLLPVKDVVTMVDFGKATKNIGDRFLVGDDESGYKIITICLDKKTGDKLDAEIVDFDEKYSVRVASRGYKEYFYDGSKLRTYDDVDAGSF